MKPKLPAFRACIKNRLSQGHDRDDAEDLCRHVDATITNIKGLPLGPQSQADENIASSPGPGWTSGGTNVGTDRVVKPDTLTVANDWAHAQRRALSKKDMPAWREHGQRMGLDPEALDVGWRTIMGLPEQVEAAALATLRTVFGESVAWRGYWVPLKQMVDPNKRVTSPHPEKEPKPEDMQMRERRAQQVRKRIGLGERVSINVKTTQAPQDGNARGTAQAANENPGFGFGTWSARKVFEMAQNLIPLYPLSKPAEILAMAIRKSGVLTSELTPEDDRLLQMAIDWAQNGPARTNIRTGGTPGGPARFTGVRGTFGL